MANAFIELSTDDVKGAIKFYTKVFGWKHTNMPDANYNMLDMGTHQTGGGISKKMQPNQPTAWLPYITVDSVKKTIKNANKAGAKSLVPYMSIGEMGAIGVFMDPTGAALGVWEGPKTTTKTASTKTTAKSTTMKMAAKSSAKKATKTASKSASKMTAKKSAAKKSSKKSSKKN
ncbi:MAG: VOC family protein [Sandaracinaceae bacterium]|nr:VOC family protein [Sandaracinaceae bacterium]